MAKPTLLRAKGIRKSFYDPVTLPILKGIDLSIEGGTSSAIMGRSGEGKSTLLQILGTLDTPCQGNLEICGHNVNSSNRNIIRNQHIAFVFQSFFLLEDCSALENILMPAKIARQPTHQGSKAYTRGINLLKDVGLLERAHFKAKMLSGGEKQRIAIARAMCNDPSIIFADEPTGNLDRDSARLVIDLLFQFADDQKKAIVLVTHDEELAGRCSTTYRLQSGLLN